MKKLAIILSVLVMGACKTTTGPIFCYTDTDGYLLVDHEQDPECTKWFEYRPESNEHEGDGKRADHLSPSHSLKPRR